MPVEDVTDALLCDVPDLQHSQHARAKEFHTNVYNACSTAKERKGSSRTRAWRTARKRDAQNKSRHLDAHPDLLVFCARSKQLAVRAETHAPDVQISGLARRLIHQYTAKCDASPRSEAGSGRIRNANAVSAKPASSDRDAPGLNARLRVVYLSGPVAPRGEELAVCGEAHAAHHAGKRSIRLGWTRDKLARRMLQVAGGSCTTRRRTGDQA